MVGGLEKEVLIMCESINNFVSREVRERLQTISNLLSDIEGLVFEEDLELSRSNKDSIKELKNRLSNILNVEIKEGKNQ